MSDFAELIEKERINCYDCSEFSEPEKIADGVCKLEWRNFRMTVARKSIKINLNKKE
ncbi:23695_t:CDS:1, partial [Dentiscutata erythropus]